MRLTDTRVRALKPNGSRVEVSDGGCVDSVCRAVQRLRQTVSMPHWTSRDLRRTAATHMGRLGVPDHVIGKIMNHSDGRITAVYNRHRYDDEKYDALRQWDQEIIKILAASDQARQAA